MVCFSYDDAALADPIEPSDGGAFLRDVVVYANAVAANFRQQVEAQPEDQLKPPVGELLKAIGRIAGRSVEYRTEARPDDVEGRPDIGITVDGQLIGLVELKAPGVGARPDDVEGRPDIGITVDGQLIGLVELKAPGVGARPETFTGRNAAVAQVPRVPQPHLHGRLGVEPHSAGRTARCAASPTGMDRAAVP